MFNGSYVAIIMSNDEPIYFTVSQVTRKKFEYCLSVLIISINL